MNLTILCLASVLYAEARGEPLDGRVAVAQVVLNRVESPRYPDNVCDVVKQRRQFASLKPDAQSITLATEILKGKFDDFSGGATHFYSGPDPFWAKHFEVVGRINNHTFMKEL